MDAATRLREAGLRVTAPRVAVFEVVVAMRHADAEAVCRRMPGTSVQAVYDNLAVLTGAGLLRRIEPAGHPARYEARVGDNHHHLVCRRCGRTEDVDCAVGASPCLVVSEAHGFAIDEAEVTFWGLCPECATRANDGGRARTMAYDREPLPGAIVSDRLQRQRSSAAVRNVHERSPRMADDRPELS